MDALEILRTLAVRWYVTVPLLIATIAGSWYAYDTALPTYRTSAVLLFVGPSTAVTFNGDTPVEVPQNPLLGSGGAQIASVITAQLLQGGDVGAELRAAELDVSYQVEADRRTPILEVSATSTVPGDALEAISFLVEIGRLKLIESQVEAGAPPASHLGFQVLRISGAESVSTASKTRNALLVGGLGLVVTVVAAAAAEGLARRRRNRLHEESPGQAETPRLEAPRAVGFDAPESDESGHSQPRLAPSDLPLTGTSGGRADHH